MLSTKVHGKLVPESDVGWEEGVKEDICQSMQSLVLVAAGWQKISAGLSTRLWVIL